MENFAIATVGELADGRRIVQSILYVDAPSADDLTLPVNCKIVPQDTRIGYFVEQDGSITPHFYPPIVNEEGVLVIAYPPGEEPK